MAQVVVDFGNYDTLITICNPSGKGRKPLRGIAREAQASREAVSVPSLIHFGPEDQIELGEEVLRSGNYDDEGTFRDLKDHVMHPLDIPRRVRERRITHKQAASTYIQQLIKHLRHDLDQDFDLVLISPGEQRKSSRKGLRKLRLEGARSVSVVDEDTALALGCEVNLFDDDLLLVLDFGFSSIRARLVQFHWKGHEGYKAPVIRAAATVPFGMADLKLGALYQLQLHNSSARLSLIDGKHPILHDADLDWLNHEKYQNSLNNQAVAAHVQTVLEQLAEQARLVDLQLDDAKRVLLAGGGSTLPAVRSFMHDRFHDRLVWDTKGLAAGRGGLTFLSDRCRDDMVHSTYSVRMRDPVSGEYLYPVIVEKFTRYPTRHPTARYIVNTFYDGQKALNLEVFKTPPAARNGSLAEAVFGADKQVSIVSIKREAEPEPAMANPLVIPVNPPGRCGERRFHLEFNVDNRKHLVVSVRDLREQKTLWEERDLIGLT